MGSGGTAKPVPIPNSLIFIETFLSHHLKVFWGVGGHSSWRHSPQVHEKFFEQLEQKGGSNVLTWIELSVEPGSTQQRAYARRSHGARRMITHEELRRSTHDPPKGIMPRPLVHGCTYCKHPGLRGPPSSSKVTRSTTDVGDTSASALLGCETSSVAVHYSKCSMPTCQRKPNEKDQGTVRRRERLLPGRPADGGQSNSQVVLTRQFNSAHSDENKSLPYPYGAWGGDSAAQL